MRKNREVFKVKTGENRGWGYVKDREVESRVELYGERKRLGAGVKR